MKEGVLHEVIPQEPPKFNCKSCGELVYLALNPDKYSVCRQCVRKRNAEWRSKNTPPTQMKGGWRNKKWTPVTW